MLIDEFKEMSCVSDFKVIHILCAFSCLFDPALDFGKYRLWFIFSSDQFTKRKPVPFQLRSHV